MASLRPRGSSIFNGIALILIGVLLLMYNYRGFELAELFKNWWPLLLIVWGAVKLYERTVGRRAADPGAARITAGEVFLVLGLLALVGIVVGVEQARQRLPDLVGIDLPGEVFANSIDVAPKPVPPNARITIRVDHGDVTVRTSDEPEIRVAGKVNVKIWSESAARRLGEQVSAEIVQNGDGYEVRPTGARGRDSRVSVDMDVIVPQKALVTVHSGKGDIHISDLSAPLSIDSGKGDIEVRNSSGDVDIDMRRGDAKISDTKGDVKISGSGSSIEVVNARALTVNGEFVGPIRADKVPKGVRFVSHRTDLTLTQLNGHMEAGSGNLEVVDAPGNLIARTHDEDIRIENATGKARVDNRNANIEMRFSFPPKDDIEITNASAGITLILPESSSFEILADCRSGDIESEFESDTLKGTKAENGDSHLEGRYGKGRGPKIALKTSYGSIAVHKAG
jgi:Domain of unknown function (DUF5668)/Putative adhesin